MEFKTKLIKKELEKDMVRVTIEGDCNDADYSTTVSEYDVDILEDENFLKSMYCINLINPREVREDDFMKILKISEDEADDFYDDFFDAIDIPRDDYDYCHTITSTEIKLYKKDGTVYDVEIERIDN